MWFTFSTPSLKVNHFTSKCQSLYFEDIFTFYPQIMKIEDNSCPLTSYLLALSCISELDDIVAEAHQGCLNRKGTFPVWGGWESEQWGVKCTAVALINFPLLIVCSRPLRLLGLTRETSAAHRLCSGFDHFTAPPTADFACNYVCSHTGWKFLFRKKYIYVWYL